MNRLDVKPLQVLQLSITRRALSALAVFIAVIASLATARAQEYSGDPVDAASAPGLKGLAVSLDQYGLRRADDGRSMWGGGKDRSARGLEVGYDVWRMSEGTRLAVAINWLTEKQTSDSRFVSSLPTPTARLPGLGSRLESHSLHAAVALRWRCNRALQPYLGVAAGGTRSRLSLDENTAYHLDSTASGLIGRASAGLRLQPGFLTVKRVGVPLFAFALAFEVGALVGTPLEFSTLTPDPPAGEKQPIAVQPVELGDLGQSGGYGRMSILIAF
jgi:hypothetical protein